MRTPIMTTLALAGLLASAAAGAQDAHSGPGVMRCTVVIGRLSGTDADRRMSVLSWVQGFLSGAAASRADTGAAADAPVLEYDALAPRVLALCKADPTADLAHVARRILPASPR